MSFILFECPLHNIEKNDFEGNSEINRGFL
jgi:hypothetical protein